MKKRLLNTFFRPFLSHFPSIYYVETDYLSSSATLCYLVFQSVKLIGLQLPFLRGWGEFARGQDHDSPCGTLVPEIIARVPETFAQKSEENMDSKELVPSPHKRMRVSYNDQCKNVSFPAHHDVVLSKKQLKSSINFSNTSKISGYDIQSGSGKHSSQRPNYFVAVQISDPQIHKRIKDIQQHISFQDSRFNDCMNSVTTLHITLMVLNINDAETHERAMKALANVHNEYNKVICKNPLILEFCGLGHFNDKVLFAKIKEDESYARLHQLADSVRQHFANFQIFSTDKRNFNPHLTIAKINFSNKKQRALKKINSSLYHEFIYNHLGSANIQSLQLLRMTGPKDSMGYYTGNELFFRLPSASSTSSRIKTDISEQKKLVREKIAEATKKAFKRALNSQETSDVKNS